MRKKLLLVSMLALVGVVASFAFTSLVGNLQFVFYIPEITELENFAQWLSAVSTFLAAVGTVGTLIFLAKQHKEIKENQDRIDRRQIEYSRKQEEFWKDQQEMANFQRHNIHYQEFVAFLSSLEHKYEGKYKFLDKRFIYQELYQTKGFEKINFDMSKINLNHEHIIVEFDTLYNNYFNTIEKFVTQDSKDFDNTYEFSIVRLADRLRIEICDLPDLDNPKVGDLFILNKYGQNNILRPYTEITKLVALVDEIRGFANLSPCNKRNVSTQVWLVVSHIVQWCRDNNGVFNIYHGPFDALFHIANILLIKESMGLNDIEIINDENNILFELVSLKTYIHILLAEIALDRRNLSPSDWEEVLANISTALKRIIEVCPIDEKYAGKLLLVARDIDNSLVFRDKDSYEN